MFVRFLVLFMSILLISCTAATPKVDSLGSSLFLASKSPSPFEQENPGNAIVFSGNCTGMAKSFEYRLDGVTAWSPIPDTAPSPGAGEWVDVSQPYDVNCENGDFNFYVFVSSVIGVATAHYGSLGSDYEPSLIEIRTLDGDDNVVPGAISFPRPVPVAYRLSAYHQASWWMGVLEQNQPLRFEVSLISANGVETKPYPSPIVISLNSTLVSGSSAGSGNFYRQDCSTLLTAADYTFNTSDRRKTYCYIPNNVTPGARFRLEASGGGLISQNHELTIVALDSALLQLNSFNDGSQRIPQTLVKGANYRLLSRLNPFDNSALNRNIQSFTGDFVMATGTSDVNFSRLPFDSICPLNQSGSMTCSSTSQTGVAFNLNIPVSSNLNSFNLNLSANPNTGCANCLVHYPAIPISLPISNYVSNQMSFQVANSSLAYSQPIVEFSGSQLRAGDCREISVSLGNSSGHTLPAPSLAPTVQISAPPGITFYHGWNCSLSYSPGFNNTVSKMHLRPDGKILVAGAFSTYNSLTRRRLAVLNPDGTLLNVFSGPDISPVGDILSLLTLPSGETLVGGNTANLANDGNNSDYLMKLRSDGRVDSSFPIRANGTIFDMVFDANSNRVYLAGSFSQIIVGVTPIPRSRIAVLDYNPVTGALSLSNWGSGINLNSTAFKVIPQGGKLYVAGGFTDANGTAVNSLARYDIGTESLDVWPIGHHGPSLSPIHSMVFDSLNNRIILGGSFTTLSSGDLRNYLAAYDVAGNLTNFNPNPNSVVQSLQIHNNQLYVSGIFSSIGASSRNGIARLSLSDDSVQTWNPVTNDGGVYKPLVVSHEAVYITGPFSVLGGQSINQFGRVNLTTGNAEVGFNSFNSHLSSISFSPFDLIKVIRVQNSGGITGPFTIDFYDGTRTIQLNLNGVSAF